MAKIVIKVVDDSSSEYSRQTLFINNEEAATVSDLYECPEDAIIGRDLVDCNDIQYWIQYGYNAAKLGDELIFE